MPANLQNYYVDPATIPSSSIPNYGMPGSLSTTGGNIPGSRNNQPFEFRPPTPGRDSGSGISVGQMLDPGGLFGGDSVFSSLFGGSGAPSWKPYYDPSTGLYYARNPNTNNPIPLSNVPGAPVGEGKTYANAAAQTRIINDMLPYLTNAVNAQQLPTALSGLQTAQITSPAYAELMANLYNTYGPVLNQIGNQIQNQNAMAQAQTEQDVINGPGKGLVSSAYDLSQVFDKPYYDSRALTAGRLGDLLNSIDLSGKLSGSERDEIEKSLARQGVQRGTQNAPSSSDTIANAMTFGQAGYQRQQQAKSNLSDAISKASAFLPTAKSGVDVFQVATGRSSLPNPGNSLFPGINQGNNQNAFGLAGSLLSNSNSQILNQEQIQSQKKDWLDQFSQLSSGISSLVGSAGKVAGGFL